MTQFDFTKFLGNGFTESMVLPFDFQALLETQRKNLQAVTEAQQLAFENAQAIVQRQLEMFSGLIEDNTSLAQELTAEGTPESKIARQADLLKKNYEKSLANWNDLNEMIGKSRKDTSAILNKRVSASLVEIKNTLEKSNQQANAKKAA